MTFYNISLRSQNPKTGPIPITISGRDTCPPACPFIRAGCYAATGPLSWTWNDITAGGRTDKPKSAKVISFAELCRQIAALPDGQLWRHNQAGDLPGIGDQIDIAALKALVAANAGVAP
jgi:hypothetical protein